MNQTATALANYPDASRFIDIDIDPAFARNPFPALAAMREASPVVKLENGSCNGVRVPDNFMFAAAGREIYLALSFNAARKVASDAENFCNALGYGETLRLTFGETLMTLDGARHTSLRKLVMPAFSHRIVTEDLARITQPIIDAALDPIVSHGAGELIAQFTAVFPYLIIARILGVPDEYAQEAEDLVIAASRMGEDPAKAIAALSGMNELYQRVVDSHRAQPADDLVSAMINTTIDGERLNDAEVVSFIKQIIAAGLDTTTRQTANLLYLLLEHPDQFDDLRANPELLDGAIHEAMRFEPAGGFVPRVATRDVEVDGVMIPAGAGVYAVIHAANRDPARWDDPDRFDIRRPRKLSMTLGAGPHACLGANLTLAEQKIAMTGILGRLPNLRKDEVRWGDAHIHGFQLRSATQIPALWDAG